MTFRTHLGEFVSGERLQIALDAVADWYCANARAVFEENAYAEHVTDEQKAKFLRCDLARAELIRAGHIGDFAVWQRVNEELTGVCVGLLG